MLRTLLAWVLTYVLAFALAELAPGSPAEQAARAGGRLPDDARAPAARQAIVDGIAREYELDGGGAARIGRAAVRAVTFDLGRSWRDGRDVSEVILPGAGGTVRRAGLALLVALALGLAAGLGAAAMGNGRERSFGHPERSFGPADVPVGPDDAPVGPGDVPVGPDDAPVGPGDVPVGPGDASVGPGDVSVGPGEVPVGPGGVPVGPGDVSVGPGDVSVGRAAGSFGKTGRSFGRTGRSFGRTGRSFGGAVIGVLVALALAVPAVWLCQLALGVSVEAAGSSTVAVVVLAAAPAAVIAAHARAAAEEMLRSPLAAAIRARGASEARVVWVHAARLAAPRLAPLAATTVGFALGAAPVVERALAVPGAGRTLAVAAASGDVPVVAALAALAATSVALTAALAQLVARRADPRLAAGRGEVA